METIRIKTSELRQAYEDNNYHTDALIVECTEEGRYDLVIELSKLAQQHEDLGYLTKEMGDKRDLIADCLLDGTSL